MIKEELCMLKCFREEEYGLEKVEWWVETVDEKMGEDILHGVMRMGRWTVKWVKRVTWVPKIITAYKCAQKCKQKKCP